MGDQDARLKVTADTAGAVAPLEKLEDQQHAVGAAGKQAGAEMSAGYTSAAKAVDAFASQAEKGGKGAERGLALATIQIEKFEKEIVQLKAQGRPTAQLEAGLDALKGKLATSTGELGRFRAAAADAADATRKATQKSGEFSGSITDVAGTLKTLSPAMGNAIDKYSILAAKAFIAIKALDAAAVAMKSVAIATDNYSGHTKDLIDSTSEFTKALTSLDLAGAAAALGKLGGSAIVAAGDIDVTTVALGNLADASKAEKFAGILKVQKDLIEGHADEIAKLDQKGEALLREIAFEKESGEVKAFLLTKLKELLDGYARAEEDAPESVKKIAAELGVLSTAQETAAKAAQSHAEQAADAANRRAAAEEGAVKRTEEALAREVEARKKALADAEAAYGKSIQDAVSDGGGTRTDPALQERTDAAKKNVDDLTGKIAELEALDFLTPEQQSQLSTMKTQFAGASQAADELARSANLGTTAIIDQAEASDLLVQNQKVLDGIWQQQADAHQEVTDELEREDEAYRSIQEGASRAGAAAGELADASGDAAKGVKDTTKAAKDLGDEGTKGFEDASAAVKTMKDELAECEPIMQRLNGLAQTLVSILSGADA